jgi:ribosomal protein L27
LNIIHDPAAKVRFDYELDDANGHRGRVIIDGTVIAYGGIEPLTNSGTASDVVFNLPDGTVVATLQDDGTPTNNTVQLASGNGAFETTTFTVPTNSLTVNHGSGTDTITVASSFAGDFNRTLTISGSAGTDTINLNAMNLTSGLLAVNGLTINLNGSITTSSSQTYNGAGVLGGNTTLTSTASGNITFASTLNGAFSLGVNTSGTTTFGGTVGGTNALSSLSVAGGVAALNGGSIATTGAQTYSGTSVTLGADTTLTNTAVARVEFHCPVNGQFSLTVNAVDYTQFSSGGNLGSLTVIRTAVFYFGINTTGDQWYGSVRLAGDTTLNSTGNENITFAGSIANPFSLTVNTGGITTFAGNVGCCQAPLLSLTTDAAGDDGDQCCNHQCPLSNLQRCSIDRNRHATYVGLLWRRDQIRKYSEQQRRSTCSHSEYTGAEDFRWGHWRFKPVIQPHLNRRRLDRAKWR